MKRAYILVTPIALGYMFRESKKAFMVKSPIPIDADFISACYNHCRSCFEVVYEDDSFEDVPEGNKLPLMRAPNMMHVGPMLFA